MSDETRRRILVAQENGTDREFAARFLETLGGYDTFQVADGMSLIKGLKNRPDLILMDTSAKGKFLPALEIIRRSEAFASTPIVIYSAEQQLLPKVANKGINGFIVKPVAPGVLLGKLWKVLGEESRQEAAAASFSDKFRKDLDKIDNLPTLPTVFAEVDRLCKNPDVGADELSKVIETDPSITLKLLSLANSAFFGFSRKINTVSEAVSLLGNKTVQNAVLNISVYEATKDLENSAGMDKQEFWAHSAGVGSVARFICKTMKIDRDEAFTAGIVHDMGKIILDSLYSDFYKDVLAEVASGSVSIYDAEADIVGLTHTKIGEELATAWNLGPELISAIGDHHTPGKSDRDAQIAHLVHVGDCVARKMGVGSGGDSLVPEVSDASYKALGISSDKLSEWEPQIQEAIDKDRSILSILQG
jgi:HD-like signal output (HDOD) protein/CheY-like chemotaxis protein